MALTKRKQFRQGLSTMSHWSVAMNTEKHLPDYAVTAPMYVAAAKARKINRTPYGTAIIRKAIQMSDFQEFFTRDLVYVIELLNKYAAYIDSVYFSIHKSGSDCVIFTRQPCNYSPRERMQIPGDIMSKLFSTGRICFKVSPSRCTQVNSPESVAQLTEKWLDKRLKIAPYNHYDY